MTLIFRSLLAVFLLVALCLFPQVGIAAAQKGLLVWRDILLPALFPFFILTEMLLALGIVRFIGVWLHPFMQTWFRLPGSGGFVLILGFLSGYPVAARLISQLLRDGQLKTSEAQRLLGIATTADPIFIMSAVCIGFFANQTFAGPLLTGHYGASIIIAFALALFTPKPPTPALSECRETLWKTAIQALHAQRRLDTRSSAQMLRDAVEHSLGLIFMIGGLVIFFFVYTSLLTSTQIMNYFYSIAIFVVSLLNIDGHMPVGPLLNGIFEVTFGMQTTASTIGVPVIFQLAVATFLLSWAGLSVHAQIMTLLQDSAVRYLPFVFYRILHGIIATMISLQLWRWLN